MDTAVLVRGRVSAFAEIDRWQPCGVAVLPGMTGTKRRWPRSWPSLPHSETWALSRERSSWGPLNLAVRLGPTADGQRILGHLDFDGIDGVDPDVALQRAGMLFPGAPLLRTSSGRWRTYFWSVREIPDCIVRELGAEVSANAGRLSIVHGVHPSGSVYEWISPPSGDLPMIDIDALGMVIESKAGTRESDVERRHHDRRRTPTTDPDRAREFESLMARVGVRRRDEDEFHVCPWHAERAASLHVTWPDAIFHCFGCGEQGGVRRLRQLLDGSLPPSYDPLPDRRVRDQRGSQLGGSEVRAERIRLADALIALDEVDRADRMRGCREATLDATDADLEAFACPNGDATPVKTQTISCDDAQCPSCMPWRLGSDWNHHWFQTGREAPQHLTLARLRATKHSAGLDDWQYIRRVRGQFRDWHRARCLRGGFYGLTLARDGDCWQAELLVAVGEGDVARLTDGRAFTVQILGRDLGSRDILRAWQHAYLREATAWRDLGDLAAFRALIKGRRKFQGFGIEFGTKKSIDEGEEKTVLDNQPVVEEASEFGSEPSLHEEETEMDRPTHEGQPLHRIAGGSGSAPKAHPCCPRCGERLRRVGRFDPAQMELLISADGVTEWRWRTATWTASGIRE